MVRKPTPAPGSRLEALMDERDHIRIRISLELDKMPKPPDANQSPPRAAS